MRAADAVASAALRTFNELRADVLGDLLLAADSAELAARSDGAAPRIDARVSVVVPALSLLGRSSEPAELLGVGPIPLETARELAAHAPSFARVLADPVTEVPIAVDRYRASAGMREVLGLRDGRCRFPGCRRAVERCDLDHTIDAAKGGATAMANLAHLCRWHHVLKHATPWTVRQLPDGVLEWRSPEGRLAQDLPRRGPRFMRLEPPDVSSPSGGVPAGVRRRGANAPGASPGVRTVVGAQPHDRAQPDDGDPPSDGDARWTTVGAGDDPGAFDVPWFPPDLDDALEGWTPEPPWWVPSETASTAA